MIATSDLEWCFVKNNCRAIEPYGHDRSQSTTKAMSAQGDVVAIPFTHLLVDKRSNRYLCRRQSEARREIGEREIHRQSLVGSGVSKNDLIGTRLLKDAIG